MNDQCSFQNKGGARMRKTSIYTTVFVFIAWSIGFSLLAQAESRKKELFGTLGYGKLYEDEGSLGSGGIFGGGIGYRITGRSQVNFEFSVHNNERADNRLFFSEGTTYITGGSYQYHFASGKVQPYIEVGAGWAHFDGMKGWRGYDLPGNEGSVPEYSYKGKQDMWYWTIGGGIRFFLNDSLSVSPEVRWLTGGGGSYQPGKDVIEPPLMIFWGGASVGYHF
jgi:hypothetical protein